MIVFGFKIFFIIQNRFKYFGCCVIMIGIINVRVCLRAGWLRVLYVWSIKSMVFLCRWSWLSVWPEQAHLVFRCEWSMTLYTYVSVRVPNINMYRMMIIHAIIWDSLSRTIIRTIHIWICASIKIDINTHKQKQICFSFILCILIIPERNA